MAGDTVTFDPDQSRLFAGEMVRTSLTNGIRETDRDRRLCPTSGSSPPGRCSIAALVGSPTSGPGCGDVLTLRRTGATTTTTATSISCSPARPAAGITRVYRNDGGDFTDIERRPAG